MPMSGDRREKVSKRAAKEIVIQTDYLGNEVTVLHYEHRGHRVREYPDGSMLIELRPGHFRNFDREHWMCADVRGEINLGSESPIQRAMYKLKDELHSRVRGTHEPVTYYIDDKGKIGVPPEPGLEPPDNVTVHTFNTLAEADRLAAKMQQQMYEDFQDDGVATEYFDRVTGFSRDEMLQAMAEGRGRKEREIARLMLEDIDQEARDRQRISTSAFFHYREFDR